MIGEERREEVGGMKKEESRGIRVEGRGGKEGQVFSEKSLRKSIFVVP